MINAISGMADGMRVESYFCIKNKGIINMARNDNHYLRITLSDKTGTIQLFYWGDESIDSVSRVWESLEQNKIVYVEGTVDSYNNVKQIKIEVGNGSIRLADSNEFDKSDFIVSTNQVIDDMMGYILGIKESMDNDHLKNLLNVFFSDADFMTGFKEMPAAISIHHACVGGLLEHTWEVLKFCETATLVHPTNLDKDLVFTGAILHDIGKIRENEVSYVISTTREGMLLGHIYMGADMVKEKISTLGDFPELLANKLLHILLSHHGKTEYGAFMIPVTPEAATVSNADMIGSKITQYIRAKNDIETTDFKTQKIYSLGCRVFLE